MATIFVIDLDRRICIARGSNVEVLSKFGDRKKASKKKQQKRGRNHVTNGKSRMDQCAVILEKHWKGYCDGNVRRKDILKEFQSRAGMTIAGASTYMEILKKRFIDRVYETFRRRYEGRHSDGWVFVDESGSKPRQNHKRTMRKAFDRAGLEDCSLHTLRHTFASRLVQAGVSLYKVSQLLGHTEIRATQIYAHLSPENAAGEAVSVLNRLNGVAGQ